MGPRSHQVNTLSSSFYVSRVPKFESFGQNSRQQSDVNPHLPYPCRRTPKQEKGDTTLTRIHQCSERFHQRPHFILRDVDHETQTPSTIPMRAPRVSRGI